MASSSLTEPSRRRQIGSWISYDVANQSFTLIINTLLFAIFFSEEIVRDDRLDDRYWALTFGTSMLLTAMLSPIAGAAADERAWKKKFLIGTGVVCSLLTCAFAGLPAGALGWAVLLYVPANVAFQLGENFLASFLPSLAGPAEVGRISAFSWACSYAAALLLLVLTGALMSFFNLGEARFYRPLFVFAGLWFLLFSVPTMLWLQEPPAPEPRGGNLVSAGLGRLRETLTHVRLYRDLLVLLAASLFYGTAMNVVVFFAGKLANEYGFEQGHLILFVAVITVTGIGGTLLPMKYQDRLGHRRCTLLLLAVWLFTALLFAGYAAVHRPDSPRWPLWLIGNLLGLGLGALGSANRAFVGYLAPPEKSAEVYGLWGMTMKLSALLTFPFAWVRDVLGSAPALLLLAGFVVVGIVLTLAIDEQRGHEAVRGAPLPEHPPGR